MSLTTGPYAIAGGGSLRIPLPRGTLVVDSVAVANLTPAPVVVTIAGTSKYVSPSGVDLFSCSSGQSYIQVTSTGTSTDAGSITTTWFDPADTPGHYPYAGAITKISTSGTITANITGPVTLAAGTSVDVASGTIDLGAGSTVAVNAGQLTATTIPLQATATQLLTTTFGTGETGTVTLSANATLTNTARYKNLTVDAGVTLTAPWIVMVSTRTVLDATSAIANNGTRPAGGLAGSFLGGGEGAHTSVTATAPASNWQGGSGGNGNYKGGAQTTHPLTTPILFGTVHNYTFGGGGGGGSGNTGLIAGGGGGGVVFVASRIMAGAGRLEARGGDGVRTTATTYSGPGGGGIVMFYSHTAKTWTGKATVLPGVTVTAPPSSSGSSGGTIVRKKFVGAIYK